MERISLDRFILAVLAELRIAGLHATAVAATYLLEDFGRRSSIVYLDEIRAETIDEYHRVLCSTGIKSTIADLHVSLLRSLLEISVT